MDQAIPFHHEDVLRGCKEIALHYHGNEAEARSINHLCNTGRFPHFHEGALICARKSV